MKKSKITTVAPQPSKDWNGKTLLKDFVMFENGDSGTVTTFPDNKQPVVGDELEYDINETQWGTEIKLPKVGGGGGFKAKAWTPAQVAQQDAVKITSAALQGGILKPEDYRAFFSEAKAFLVAQIEADNLPI